MSLPVLLIVSLIVSLIVFYGRQNYSLDLLIYQIGISERTSKKNINISYMVFTDYIVYGIIETSTGNHTESGEQDV